MPDLLDLADHALDAGACEWAHAVAREAASHAADTDRLRAHTVAGRAALACGLVDDACAWLAAPVAASVDVAAAALAPYVRAVTLREGSVPDADIAWLVAALENVTPEATALEDTAPETAPSETTPRRAATGLLEAVAAAAQLHAERGHGAEARAMLEG